MQIIAIFDHWLMPGIKGDEFPIQVDRQFPDPISAMLTGQADSAATRRAREEANLHACLHKPWTEEELAQVINSALE